MDSHCLEILSPSLSLSNPQGATSSQGDQMGRFPINVRKGSWTEEEDILLRRCIEKYGEGKWRHVPARAGLNRCRKSCRLRWLNYLRPNIKRGEFASDEVDLIIRLHKLLGNRWSLIAGRIPGRTANDIKNYWNSHLSKRLNVEHRSEPSITHPNLNEGNSKSLDGFCSGLVDQNLPEEDSFWRKLLFEAEEEETGASWMKRTSETLIGEGGILSGGFESLLSDMELWGVIGSD